MRVHPWMIRGAGGLTSDAWTPESRSLRLGLCRTRAAVIGAEAGDNLVTWFEIAGKTRGAHAGCKAPSHYDGRERAVLE
jgi:hypothetical protein